jgi:DNA-binding CsgD family transcriptional regulator
MEARERTQRQAGPAAADGLLVEREGPLALLDSALAGLEAGRGSAVALDGPYGSGKSALLEAAAARARERGLQVLTGGGRRLERELELGVALQLFENRVDGADPEELERLLAGPAQSSLRLFQGGPAGAAAEPPGALVHGLYRLCANLAAELPLVLVVDDVDMADLETLRFLLYLVGRVESVPVVLLVARGSALGREGLDFLDELQAHPATRGQALGPLGPAATAAAVRAALFPDAGDGFCAAVHAATGGSPWLVGELCRDLASRGIAPEDGSAALVAAAGPAPVADAVRRRARAVDADAAPLLDAAAVLGDGAELRHAAALAGVERTRAARLADALHAIGVLEVGDRLAFAQPVVRRAVRAALPAAERAEAHLRAAQALAADDAPAEAVAEHLLDAGRGDGEWVTATLRAAAARTLARGDAPRAVALLRRAREEPPPREQRAAVLLELGRAEAIAGAPDALGTLADAIERLPGGGERAATALQAGRTLLGLGRLDDAAAAFRLGERYAEDGEEDLSAHLRTGRVAVEALARGSLAAPRRGGEPPERGDTPTRRALLAQLALDAALRGERHERVAELAARALARGSLLDDEGAEGVAYYAAASALTIAEDLGTAEAALTAAVDDARSRGSALALATASHFQSLAIMRRGRVAASAEAARTALGGERHGWRLGLPAAHGVAAWALAEGGDLDGAGRHVESASAAAGGDAASRLAVLAARAHLALARRANDQALADFLACGEILHAAGAPNPGVMPWRSGAARALAALGDRGEALRLAEEELTLAEAFGAPGGVGRALRTLGVVETGKRSVEALEAAVDRLEGSQTALERARALVDLGCALRRARRPRDSREPLRRGLDLAQRCGAGELAALAMREVTAAGARPRRTALHGLEALTPRELQTAELAAAGMSNREIADALFVTVKTVEWHLKHGYGKLGIASRGELGAALERRYPPPAGE